MKPPPEKRDAPPSYCALDILPTCNCHKTSALIRLNLVEDEGEGNLGGIAARGWLSLFIYWGFYIYIYDI